ncbi:hypothetical protein ATCC90586_000347 [Pythium insidiosum]|nr:hypothetical protein ATCC90586_000347 [Pythium insidiosum]
MEDDEEEEGGDCMAARRREDLAAGVGRLHGSALAPARPSGDAIEHELKRLRLAQARDGERPSWWRHGQQLRVATAGAMEDEEADTDDGDTAMADAWADESFSYRQINATLRDCHFLRQLRRFQAERLSYLDRRPPSDAVVATTASATAALCSFPRY